LATTCTTWEGFAAYTPREPERTVLYHVLQEHLETFLEHAQADGRNLPSFVVKELRGFLRCGIRAYGFLRVRCPSCRHEYAVAFSSKGRGVCPSVQNRQQQALGARHDSCSTASRSRAWTNDRVRRARAPV